MLRVAGGGEGADGHHHRVRQKGATHAMDIMFANFGSNVFSFAYSTANKPGREALSNAMIDSLSAFARTGNPNTPALNVTWRNYPAKLVLDASPTQLQISAP